MNKEYIDTKHGKIQLPAFMPDATYGSVRSTSFSDLKNAGINEIVTTTLHIEQKIGSKYIKKFGGLHKFFGWDKPILTDSGGWQVFSLINSALKPNLSADEKRKLKKNKLSELGCTFIDEDTGKVSLLTPESSQVIQFNLGADILTVLDDPIIGHATKAEREESVRINTNWAKRSKTKFLELHKINSEEFMNIQYPISNAQYNSKPITQNTRPLLGAVIQGADDLELRKRSAEELIEIGFDIYNFGGIPMKSPITWQSESDEGFYREMLSYVSELIPNDKYKYAMGVGQPDDIAFCVEHGWDLFDTVLPTRNARHGYLYVTEGQGDSNKRYQSPKTSMQYSYDVLHLKSERYVMDEKPVDEFCDCEACQTVSRAYLRHLIRINEPAGFRLATIHNLRFYARWMENLRVNLKSQISNSKQDHTL